MNRATPASASLIGLSRPREDLEIRRLPSRAVISSSPSAVDFLLADPLHYVRTNTMRNFLFSALPIVVIIAVLIGVKTYNKTEAASEIKTQVYKVLSQLQGHANDPGYFRSLVDDNHDEAFKPAYDVGGRYRSATFNRRQYFERLHSLMVEQARRDGRDWVSRSLRNGKSVFLSAAAQAR